MRTPYPKFFLVCQFLAINFISLSGHAQSVDSLSEAPNPLIHKISSYPDEMHRAILTATQYPEALLDLKRASIHADESFENMVTEYNEEHRQHMLRLFQCPETIDHLVMVGRNNPDRANMFLQHYSDSAKRQFLFAYNNRYDDLMKLDKIYQSIQTTMFISTEKYPDAVQKSFKIIITSPEVVKLLTDSLDETERLGVQVKTDSAKVYRQLSSDNFSASSRDNNVEAYYWNVVSHPAKEKNGKTEMSDDQIQAAHLKKIRTINTIFTIARIGLMIYTSSSSGGSHHHRRR